MRKAKTFDGKDPCLRGHVGPRYCSNGACVQCRRADSQSARLRRNSAAVGERLLTVYLPAGQLEQARVLAAAMGWRLFDGADRLA